MQSKSKSPQQLEAQTFVYKLGAGLMLYSLSESRVCEKPAELNH